MHEWTQKAAENELNEILTALLHLQENGFPTSPEHVHWHLRTVSYLREVFGEDSLYFRSFMQIRWRYSGTMAAMWSEVHNPLAAQARHDLPVYAEAVGLAAGVLHAAGDELKRKGINSVFQGKTTKPKQDDTATSQSRSRRTKYSQDRQAKGNSVKPRLFIASSIEGLSVAYAAQANLDHDAEVTVWQQGVFKLSGYPVESLVSELNKADFGAFVFSPDDVVRIRHKQQDAVRDNVIFELGLFIGRLGRERCFLLVPRGEEKLHIPTDLLGLTPGTFGTDRQDGNLQAALGPACHQIREAITMLGQFVSPQPEAQQPRTEPTNLDSLDADMPDLLAAMRKDIEEYPLFRDVLLLRSTTTRLSKPHEGFVYTRDVIPNLESKFKILENRGLVKEMTSGSVPRYRMSEDFVAFLGKKTASAGTASSSDVALRDHAKALLLEAAKDTNGTILFLQNSEGYVLQTNNRQLITSQEAKHIAQWKGALDELTGCHYLEPQGTDREIFVVTEAGHEYAERHSKTESA